MQDVALVGGMILSERRTWLHACDATWMDCSHHWQENSSVCFWGCASEIMNMSWDPQCSYDTLLLLVADCQPTKKYTD